MDTSPLDLNDRAAGAAGSVAAVSVTALVLAFFVLAVTPGAVPKFWKISSFFENLGSFTWSFGVLAFAAGVAGYRLGSVRAASMFGHLWLTEKPRRIGLSLAMWAVISLVLWINLRMVG